MPNELQITSPTSESRSELPTDDAVWREVFKRRLDAMENAVSRIDTNTAELVEMMQAWRGTMKVLGWITKPATAAAALVAALAAVYTAWPKR